jgi:hypothetical protein
MSIFAVSRDLSTMCKEHYPFEWQLADIIEGARKFIPKYEPIMLSNGTIEHHPRGRFKDIERERLKPNRQHVLATYPQIINEVQALKRTHPHIDIDTILSSIHPFIEYKAGRCYLRNVTFGHVPPEVKASVLNIAAKLTVPEQFDLFVPNGVNFDLTDMGLERLLQKETYSTKNGKVRSSNKIVYTPCGKICYSLTIAGDECRVKYMVFSRSLDGQYDISKPNFAMGKIVWMNNSGNLRSLQDTDFRGHIRALADQKVIDKLDIVIGYNGKKWKIYHIEHQPLRENLKLLLEGYLSVDKQVRLINGIHGSQLKTYRSSNNVVMERIHHNSVEPMLQMDHDVLVQQPQYSTLIKNQDYLGGPNLKALLSYVSRNYDQLCSMSNK